MTNKKIKGSLSGIVDKMNMTYKNQEKTVTLRPKLAFMTIKDIEILISNDETRNLELKKSTGELKDGMRTACAFLNTDGGWLVFGVTPTSLKMVGQQVTDSTRKEIAQELTKIEPAESIEVEYVEIGSKRGYYVIVIHIDKALFRDEPYVYDGRPYYRVESTTKLMPQEMYQKLLRKKDARRRLWEEEPNPNITIEQLDEDALWRLVRSGIEVGRIPERMLHRSLSEVINSMHLSTNGVLKNAIAALFVKEEFAPIQMHLKMARFDGTTKLEFIDNRRTEGNIFKLFDDGMQFFFKHLNISGTFVDGQPERIETLTIPYKALRECLLNALAHRVYHQPSSFVSIAIYDDRVEVANTGQLPDDLTLEQLINTHSSHAQNPLIAQVMYYGKYLETWGRGIELMQEQCAQAGMKPPIFNYEGGCFRVTFIRPDYEAKNGSMEGSTKRSMKGSMKRSMKGSMNELTDYDLMLLDLMESNSRITVSAMAERIGISRANTYKHLVKLQKNGYLKREGPDRGGFWRVLKR